MKQVYTLLLLIAASLASGQSVIYVDAAASGANNGASWSNAFTDLQDALDTAQAGDELWLAQGVYYPSKDTNGLATTDPRLKSFVLKDSVSMYGGFTGSETLRTQRDWHTNLSVLSGDVGVVGDSSDNSLHVVFVDSNMSSATIIDGLQISHGNNYDASIYGYDKLARSGAGMYIKVPTRLILKNLLVKNNWGYQTGGLHVQGVFYQNQINNLPNRGLLQLINCRISGNFASGHPGLKTVKGRLRMVNCAIRDNWSLGTGSYTTPAYFAYSDVKMYNCTVAGGRGYAWSLRTFGYTQFYAGNCIFRELLSINDQTGNWCYFENCLINGSGGSSNWQYTNYRIADLGGNIDAYPNFVSNDDFHLTYLSPARNAGNAALLPFDTLDLDQDGITMEPFPLDLDDQGRVYMGQVDMGAYEYYALGVTDSVVHRMCPGDSVLYKGAYVDSNHTFDELVSSSAQGDSLQFFTVFIDSVDVGIDLGFHGAEFIAREDSAHYMWYNCDNGYHWPQDTHRVYVPQFNGNYKVVVTSKLGCTDTSECISINNVALDQSDFQSEWELYPNPAKDYLEIKLPNHIRGKAIRLNVYTLTGKLIFQKMLQPQSDKGELMLQNLAPGMYLLVFPDGEIKRFILSGK